jgi:hypothetical protein
MGKRQREDDGEEDEGEKELRKAGAKLPSHIKNKHKRSEAYSKLKHEKVLDKKKRIKARDLAEKQALELGEVPEPRKIPRTIENTREIDETLAQPDDEEVFLLLVSHDLLYGSLCKVFKTLAQSDDEEAFLLLVSHGLLYESLCEMFKP